MRCISGRRQEVSESGYYARRSRATSVRSIRHAWLTEVIRKVRAASRGTYGVRRVHAQGGSIVAGYGATGATIYTTIRQLQGWMRRPGELIRQTEKLAVGSLQPLAGWLRPSSSTVPGQSGGICRRCCPHTDRNSLTWRLAVHELEVFGARLAGYDRNGHILGKIIRCLDGEDVLPRLDRAQAVVAVDVGGRGCTIWAEAH